MSPRVVACGAFDNPGSSEVRFLHEASRLGELYVSLWSDGVVHAVTGRPPRFPLEERRYVLEAIRHVAAVSVIDHPPAPGEVPEAAGVGADIWAVREAEANQETREACASRGVRFEPISSSRLAGFPEQEATAIPEGTGVLVTGCYDWLHSGHVRFFEEVSALGTLTVVIGNDANVRSLKGDGHPLFPEAERRYMVQAIRFVSRTLISSGWGWLDAEHEILKTRPAIYAVNEDGDRPEKRAFCAAQGIKYVVLTRSPREGLARRSSTDLRGF